MPPKTPKAKPRPTPRRISGAAAPEAPPAPTTSTTPVAAASAGEAVQTQPPIAPPAGRLDSLISPPTPSRSSQGGIAAGGAGSGRGAAIPLKFKPKNVPRKSKEEREALDAKFEITVVPIPRPRGGGSTRGPRGGRGGRSGFGRNDSQVTAGASGPFSLGSVTTRDRAQKITVERGNDFGRHRQLGFKGRTAAEPSSSKIKSEDPVPDNVNYSASSSDSEGPRMDVEYISLLDDARSDDEDDDMELEPMWGAGAPVRVPRSAHIDRAAQVNTEASSSRKWKFDLGRKGKEVLFEETVKVKDEPPDGDEGIAALDVKSSPGTSRKKGVKTQSPETKKRGVPAKTRKRSSSRRRKTILSSLEDKEELEREETDRIATLMELAGGLARVKVDDGDDDDIAMAGSVETPQHRNAETENQIFVFQFPNILPQLVLPVKEQPLEDEDADTPDKLESPNEEPHLIRPPKLPTTSQRKLSAKAQQVLLESYPPPGIAGKLRVHRSGRITMLWGTSDSADEESSAFSMDVTRGTQCEFLQELVVLRQQSPWGDQDVDERGKRKGVAFSLGQVKGKFVVSPDFEQLLKGEKKKKGKGKGRGKEKGVEVEVEVEVAGK